MNRKYRQTTHRGRQICICRSGRVRKFIASVIMAVMVLSLPGCGVFQTFEGQNEEKPHSYANVYELSSGKAYVWDNVSGDEIRKDLSQNRVGSDVFFICPTGDINFKGDETADMSQYKRSIWMSSDKDDRIPTVCSSNALIYISDTAVPDDIIFERYADYGYSIGISNMVPDGGGHYYIVYSDTDEDDYKYYVDMKSDAADIAQFDALSRLYLDKVGDMSVSEGNVSEGGTVMGLDKDQYYICEFYTGTFYQDFRLRADIHCFGELERFVCHEYEFLHANCIRIKIPEWFKSGYYFVQGVGLFRYVTQEDMAAYNGLAYDPGIDWNDPIKMYDEYGVCIFDPSQGIDRRDSLSENVIGSEDMEVTIGASKEESK